MPITIATELKAMRTRLDVVNNYAERLAEPQQKFYRNWSDKLARRLNSLKPDGGRHKNTSHSRLAGLRNELALLEENLRAIEDPPDVADLATGINGEGLRARGAIRLPAPHLD